MAPAASFEFGSKGRIVKNRAISHTEENFCSKAADSCSLL